MLSIIKKLMILGENLPWFKKLHELIKTKNDHVSLTATCSQSLQHKHQQKTAVHKKLLMLPNYLQQKI